MENKKSKEVVSSIYKTLTHPNEKGSYTYHTFADRMGRNAIQKSLPQIIRPVLHNKRPTKICHRTLLYSLWGRSFKYIQIPFKLLPSRHLPFFLRFLRFLCFGRIWIRNPANLFHPDKPRQGYEEMSFVKEKNSALLVIINANKYIIIKTSANLLIFL